MTERSTPSRGSTSRTSTSYITVGTITAQVTYKPIKHLHIKVYPPKGEVKVSAPLRYRETWVRQAIVEREHWIIRQQANIQSHPTPSPLQFQTGDTIHIWGKPHQLQIVEQSSSPSVVLHTTTVEFHVPPGTSTQQRRAVWYRWLAETLRKRLAELLPLWEKRMGMHVPVVKTRVMKTRWGSCNTVTRHITINVELAKYPSQYLEYVLVHEMTHYIQRLHNPEFYALMDQQLPDWRELKKQLTALTRQQLT